VTSSPLYTQIARCPQNYFPRVIRAAAFPNNSGSGLIREPNYSPPGHLPFGYSYDLELGLQATVTVYGYSWGY